MSLIEYGLGHLGHPYGMAEWGKTLDARVTYSILYYIRLDVENNLNFGLSLNI